jgi:hypothetical protein
MHLNNMYYKTQYMLDCLMATHLKHNNLKFFDKSAVLICLEITFNDAKKCKQTFICRGHCRNTASGKVFGR